MDYSDIDEMDDDDDEEDNEKLELILDASPGVQFIARSIKQQEAIKSIIMQKLRTLQSALQCEIGTISYLQEKVEGNLAFTDIVNGQVKILKKQLECINKMVNQLKSQLKFYIN